MVHWRNTRGHGNAPEKHVERGKASRAENQVQQKIRPGDVVHDIKFRALIERGVSHWFTYFCES